MNRFLLLIFAVALASCSVEEIEDTNPVLQNVDAVAADYGCAGPDNSITRTPEFVDENLYTTARIKRFYLNLLEEGVSREGTFSPSISELASDYLENPIGDFTTTYSVSNNECQDSVILTLTVAEAVDDTCADLAGADQTRTITPEYVQEQLYTDARIKRFFLNMLEDGVREDGTFNPTIAEIKADYLNNGLGTYTTTYSVEEGNCQDSAQLTIIIEEACDITAGSDNTVTITSQFVEEELDTDAKIDRFFLDLLDEGISEDGDFSPSIQDIKIQYMNNGPGTYTTVYTVGEGSCQDSAELTLIIEDVCNVNAGSDNTVTITPQFVAQQLDTDAKINRFFFDLLDEGVSADGEFTPSIQDIKIQYMNNGPGTYTTVYTVGEGTCQDSAEITVIIKEECNVNAGSDKYVTVTRSYVQNNLYTAARIKRFYLNLLDSGVSKEGTFDPTISEIASSYSKNPIGEFTTVYTVGSGDCTDDVNLTINVVE